MGSKMVQSTSIFVANFIRYLRGAAHRNAILFRCAAPFRDRSINSLQILWCAAPFKIRTHQPCLM